jgi:hypothetical protein
MQGSTHRTMVQLRVHVDSHTNCHSTYTCTIYGTYVRTYVRTYAHMYGRLNNSRLTKGILTAHPPTHTHTRTRTLTRTHKHAQTRTLELPAPITWSPFERVSTTASACWKPHMVRKNRTGLNVLLLSSGSRAASLADMVASNEDRDHVVSCGRSLRAAARLFGKPASTKRCT